MVASVWLFGGCFCHVEGKGHQPTNGVPQQHKRIERTLVPPPPPTTPAVGQPTFPVPIEMLSDKDLQARRQEVESALSQMQEKLELKSANLKEKKERSELFSSLYKEGVVSRKEYEGSCQEALDAELTVKETSQKVSELEQCVAHISARLKELSKSSAKPAVAGTRKKQ